MSSDGKMVITLTVSKLAAFGALKDALMNELMVAQPDATWQFLVKLDAGLLAVRRVLLQISGDSLEQPVAYMS